ncbi:hypothetical protein DUNSADRAFT_14041 [Dunaliella salina]|uniref:Secreted protein n=1 Tax=Dunaliella salina TaxID=3046 RepID=A0ABQ7G861_DUNSA|nr:hypothetical protein DUNSADRAFT_14041 [Dunaliella salina]|eukprot:KAF5830792.1 hypothetical protein DUNSADRAFT_14041 [Dunaliella salina]
MCVCEVAFASPVLHSPEVAQLLHCKAFNYARHLPAHMQVSQFAWPPSLEEHPIHHAGILHACRCACPSASLMYARYNCSGLQCHLKICSATSMGSTEVRPFS